MRLFLLALWLFVLETAFAEPLRRCEPIGAPALPEEIEVVEIPEGTVCTGVSYSVQAWVPLGGTNDTRGVVPQPIQRPRCGDRPVEWTPPDALYYAQDIWPEKPVELAGVFTVTGRRLQRVRVSRQRWRGGLWQSSGTGVVEVAEGLSFRPLFSHAAATPKLQHVEPPLGATRENACGTMGTPSASDCKLLILAPPDLRDAWEIYAAARRTQLSAWTISVVGTDEVYRDHPFGVGLACRNAAESIHVFIRSAAQQGTTHVLLGGMWCDATQEMPERYFTTGERLSLSNCVPGICARPHLDERCTAVPSDLFFACLDGNSEGEAYPWDSDGDGVYLSAAEADFCDCVADIAIGRFAPVPYDAGDGVVLTPFQIVTNYAARVARGMGAEFAGTNRLGLASGRFAMDVPRGSTSLGRPHHEQTFFDDAPNIWDPSHPDAVTDEEWATRETLRTVIAPQWPILEVESLHSDVPLFAARYATREVAQTNFLARDQVYAMCRSHGSETVLAGGWLTRDLCARAAGMTLFCECALPCQAGSLACTRTREGRTCILPSLGMAATASARGGTLAGLYNVSYGFGDEFGGMTLSDGYSSTVGYLIAKNLFENGDKTFGDAVLHARQQYAAQNAPQGVQLFLLCEQFFFGDPSLGLPTCRTTMELPTDMIVSGKIASVSAHQGTDAVVRISGDGMVKVMEALSCAGTNLEISCEGGVGGRVSFTKSAGCLSLTGLDSFYVGGVSNCTEILLAGNGKTVDVTGAGAILRSIVCEGPGTNTVRCTTTGGLSGLEPIHVEGGWLRLETAESFGTGSAVLATVTNGVVLWTASPLAGWDGDTEHLARPVWLKDAVLQADGQSRVCWGRHTGNAWQGFVLHVAGTSAVSSAAIGLVGTTTVELEEGGVLNLTAGLQDIESGRLVFTGTGCAVATRVDCLAGEVEVREGAVLELVDVPLNVTSLVVRAGATLRIPVSEPGRHDLVTGRGILQIEPGAFVEDRAGHRLEGFVLDRSFFEPKSTLRWKGGVGVWSDAVGWFDPATGTHGPWIDGRTAIFDAAEGASVSNDLPHVAVPGFVFAANTTLTGGGIQLESGSFTVPTNVGVFVEIPLAVTGEIAKYGTGSLTVRGAQDALRDGGVAVVEGTLCLEDVMAPGVTNLAAAAGTHLELVGRNILTNAAACATLATNALVCASETTLLALENFRPQKGTLVPRGMELVVMPRDLKGYAYWNMAVEGLFDYRGTLSLLYGRIEGPGTVRVRELRSQSTSGATFGACRLECVSDDGVFPVYEDLSWGRGLFVFDGTTVAPTGSLVVSSAVCPESQTILYVDDAGIAFDVPDHAELVFGDAEPTYLFGGSGGLVKRGPGGVRFTTVADQHDGPTWVEEGVYALGTWTTTRDVRVAMGGVADLTDPYPTQIALTNLVLEAGSRICLSVSDDGADLLDVRGGVCALPTNGVARLEVTILPGTSPGYYGVFAAGDFLQKVEALDVRVHTPAGHRIVQHRIAEGLVLQVRPPATTILFR